jgi:archaellum component FlaC
MKAQIAAVKTAINDLENRLKDVGKSYRNQENITWWFEQMGQEGLDRRTAGYEKRANDIRENMNQLWNVIATLAVCESMMGGK